MGIKKEHYIEEILDAVGLDPRGIAEVRDTILKLNRKRNMTIMISSHILDELSKIVDRYGIIHNGVLVEELTKEELVNKSRDYIEIITNEPDKACVQLDQMKID